MSSHDSDGSFQIAEVFINVRAGQDAVPPTVLNQDAASLRGWRLARSGKADSVVLHPVEHGVRNFFGVRNLFRHGKSLPSERPTGARAIYAGFRLSLIGASNAAKICRKSLILLVGGPRYAPMALVP